MDDNYVSVKRLSKGLIGVNAGQYGHQMWVFCIARPRNRRALSDICRLCDAPILKGQEVFRPMTNGYNRGHRIHVSCVDNQFTKEPK